MLNLKTSKPFRFGHILLGAALNALVWAGGLAVAYAEEEPKLPLLQPAAKRQLLAITTRLVAAGKAKDAVRFAAAVHPGKGVRISASYEDFAKLEATIFTPALMRNFWKSVEEYHWGNPAGSGDPITLTPAEFARRFIFDRDFTAPDRIEVDRVWEWSEHFVINRIRAAFPNGRWVAFSVKGPGPKENPEWSGLAFVFERLQGRWYLVGVLHQTFPPRAN